MKRVLAPRWLAMAVPYTELERRRFGLWRGGDPVSRFFLVLFALAIGGFVVWTPFIPIEEKWFPFLLAIIAPFLPEIVTTFHLRRYTRELLALARTVGAAERELDLFQPLADLLPPSQPTAAEELAQPTARSNDPVERS